MSGVGDVLAARYTLLREAWRTPRGAVWQARDGTLDRRVHVLLLDSRLLDDTSRRRAFVDEAAQLAAITDPYLAAVYDIGNDPPFVVFEDPGGGRLSDKLRSGPLDGPLAARIAANVARGIQALEKRGEGIPRVSADAVLVSSDGRGKLSILSASAEPGADPRRELARLTVLMFTGDEPLEDNVSKKDLPQHLADACTRMLQGLPMSLDSFVDACGALTRPAPVKHPERSQRSGGGDIGWLFGVITIVILAIAAVVIGPGLLERLAKEDPSPTPTATSTRGAPGDPIAIESISDFDPDGNGEEHANQVGRAIDGDPLSAWTTVGYKQAGMDKAGVGLLLDLGSEIEVASVQVQTSIPGWNAEIRISSVEPEGSEDLSTVTSFTAGSDTTVALPAGTKAQYIVIWITRLADDSGESDFPFRASVNELVVLS